MARPRDFDEEEVLDSAMEVFWRHGYEGTSFAELTKAMNMNSPSIYGAFGSKRGLFDAVVRHYRKRRAPRGAYAFAGATAFEVARRFLFDSIDWLTDPKEPLGCLLVSAGLSAGSGNADVPTALVEQRGEMIKKFTERFQRAKRDGDLPRSADPEALARYLQMVFLGLAVQAQDGLPRKQLEESAEQALLGWPVQGAKRKAKGSSKTVPPSGTTPTSPSTGSRPAPPRAR